MDPRLRGNDGTSLVQGRSWELTGRGPWALSRPSCQSSLQNLEADLGSLFIRSEPRDNLLLRVDVVSKITQAVTEFADVKFQNAHLPCNVDQLCLLQSQVAGPWRLLHVY